MLKLAYWRAPAFLPAKSEEKYFGLQDETQRRLHAFALLPAFIFFQKGAGVALDKILDKIKVKAPFNMPEIKVPDFSKCKKLRITDFRAVTGDKEKTPRAIN